MDILRVAEVGLVVDDVQSFPRSRSNPEFHIEVLPQSWIDYQIGYRHILALGGRRKIQLGFPDELDANAPPELPQLRQLLAFARVRGGAGSVVLAHQR